MEQLLRNKFDQFRHFSSFQTFVATHGIMCFVLPEGTLDDVYWRGCIRYVHDGKIVEDDTGTSKIIFDAETNVMEYVIDLLINKNIEL
jgi:hypothetical protein